MSAYGNQRCDEDCSQPENCPISPQFFYRADIDGDCEIGLQDLTLMLSSFGFTDASSLHANYVWDAENRLIEVTPGAPTETSKRVTFDYDYLSRRVAKRVYAWNTATGQWETVPSAHTR